MPYSHHALTVTCVLLFAPVVSAETAPNIVFFLVDDLGWSDIGCNGSDFHETPHIDSLAESGMRFTQGYAACPVCSPTRASIMTGRHPVRVEITDWLPGAAAERYPDRKYQHVHDRENLALNETTIAEHLKQTAGYDTWFLGKWHLGDEGHWPKDQGFDVNIGGCSKGSPPGGYYAPWKNPNLSAKEQGEYVTTRLTDEAVELIQQQAKTTSSDAASPFLMMFSYYNVHTPITADKRTIAHYKAKASDRFTDATPTMAEGPSGISRGRQDNPDYASMVHAVDISVGRVLQAIESAGIADNTIVVFFSDNGGLCTTQKAGPTSNLPLRSGKGWLYEGGIREPMIIRAPGITQAGSVTDAVVCSTDFFPTLVDLVGLPSVPELASDGVSLVPTLRGTKSKNRSLYWHYPHYHGSTWTPGAAIRQGDWKLIEFYEHDRVELYDLSHDVGEQNDLAKSEPEIRERLRTELLEWQQEMNAKMPQLRQ